MPTISGAMLMTDRASLDQLGGFDEGYFLHVEDIAICRAARVLGGEVIFAPDARALHHGATSDVSSLTVERHKLKSFLRYFWTDQSPLAKLKAILIAPLMTLAIIVRWAVRSVKG